MYLALLNHTTRHLRLDNWKSAECSLLHRVQDLLRRKPQYYDVIFSVGQAKKKVKAVRILLEAASPVLEKKFEVWENSVVRKGSEDGIPLPNFDPEAFEIFVKLTMLDDWTPRTLLGLKLKPDQILNLILICDVFEIQRGLIHLEALMKSFYNTFDTFKNTQEFLCLSYSHLKTILASDHLPMKETDVFECACRWAEVECEKLKIKTNDENLRVVLGTALYEIRFPLMTPEELTHCVNTHNILTPAEGFEIFRFISFNETQRECLNISEFPFKTKIREGWVQFTMQIERKAKLRTIMSKVANLRDNMIQRKMSEFSTLCLAMDSPIVDSPPFVCDGIEEYNWIATKQKIRVHGLGFLGPIDGDADYDVTVQLEKCVSPRSLKIFERKPIKKQISAKRGEIFRVMLDEPIELTEGSFESRTNEYCIVYSLKGPKTNSFQRTACKTITKRDGENEFELQLTSNPLAEILYTIV